MMKKNNTNEKNKLVYQTYGNIMYLFIQTQYI